MVRSTAATRWAAIIDAQEASGLNVRAYAEANQLNPSTLSWWRSQLRRGVVSPEVVPRFARVDVAPDARPPPRVVVSLDKLRAHVIVDAQTDLALLRQVLEGLC